MMKPPKDLAKRTKRLELRAFRVSDYGVWKEYKLRTQRAKNRWDRIINKPSDASLSAFRRFLKKLRSDESRDFTYTFGVFLRHSAELIEKPSINSRLTQSSGRTWSYDVSWVGPEKKGV